MRVWLQRYRGRSLRSALICWGWADAFHSKNGTTLDNKCSEVSEPYVRILADELSACLERSYKKAGVAPTNALAPMRAVTNLSPEVRVS